MIGKLRDLAKGLLPEGKAAQENRSAPRTFVYLSMAQVFDLAKAAFISRGFPDIGVDYLAHQIVWLEARGISGLTYLTSEFTLMNNGCWNERQPRPDQNKRLIFDCPIISGTVLEDYFEQLVLPDPEEINGIMGPTHPLLLLPRVAGYSARIGSPIVVYFKAGEPLAFAGRILVNEDRILIDGDIRDIWNADGLSFSRFPNEMPPESHGAILNKAAIDTKWMLRLAEFIARDQIDARPY